MHTAQWFIVAASATEAYVGGGYAIDPGQERWTPYLAALTGDTWTEVATPVAGRVGSLVRTPDGSLWLSASEEYANNKYVEGRGDAVHAGGLWRRTPAGAWVRVTLATTDVMPGRDRPYDLGLHLIREVALRGDELCMLATRKVGRGLPEYSATLVRVRCLSGDLSFGTPASEAAVEVCFGGPICAPRRRGTLAAMAILPALALGVLLSAVVAAIARRRGSLTTSGALAAVAVGTPIFAAGSGCYLALLGFFVTSSALGRVGDARKARLRRDYAKGDQRDAWQVVANGGVAAACAVVQCIRPDLDLTPAILGALATANGDTWATELGPLSPRPPRSLRTLRPVPAGTSGAVSGVGLAATVAGGALVGALLGLVAPGPWWRWLGLGAVCGAAGSLVDSLLGATVQAGFRCPTCARPCEAPRHACGSTRCRSTGCGGSTTTRSTCAPRRRARCSARPSECEPGAGLGNGPSRRWKWAAGLKLR